MTIPEEIEELKIKLEKTTDEREQAEVLMEMLGKYARINSIDSHPYIQQLLQLAEALNEPLYKAWGLHHLANLKRNKDEYGASIDLSRQAMPLFELVNEMIGVGISYNNIGIAYLQQGNYPEALKNHFAALKLREEVGDKIGIATSYNSIGNVYKAQGNYPEALKNHFAALKLREEIGDKIGIATSYNNIGIVFRHQGNYPETLKNYFTALKLRKEIGDKIHIASSYSNIGVVYYNQDKYPEALKNYFTALRIQEEIADKHGIAVSLNNIGNVYEMQNKYPEALKNYFSALKICEGIGDQEGIAISYHAIGSVFEKQGNYPEALKEQLRGLQMGEKIGQKDFSKVSSLSLSNTYKALGDFENALKYHEKYHQIETELLGEQAQKQLTQLNFQHNMEQKEKDLEIAHLRNVELKKERDRSEALLLNILPAEVAEELKEKGSAEAKLFDEVTVLFTDFKSFTTVSEKLTPQELVGELNECFKAFDDIIGKYNIEKIKTVGDAYLAAAGLPSPNQSHADDMIKAALEIRNFMVARKKELGNRTFEMRVGIHSGSVVAGIVGVKKFAYDIWGDTVNTAARMEQNGVTGKVNISHTTYELVKDKFICEYRGEIDAKNKGKLKMYFVEG